MAVNDGIVAVADQLFWRRKKVVGSRLETRTPTHAFVVALKSPRNHNCGLSLCRVAKDFKGTGHWH
jgi:hypothetical protein